MNRADRALDFAPSAMLDPMSVLRQDGGRGSAQN
jgi:hypothetical protein